MLLDYAVDDSSANLARRIVERGLHTLAALSAKVGGSSEICYVACPDFSISLRQRRLILGLPIGGYVNLLGAPVFPLELDVNSCGVHVVHLPDSLDDDELRKRVYALKERVEDGAVEEGGTILKWNLARRNHFINIYEDIHGARYLFIHAGGETRLFDKRFLEDEFVRRVLVVDGREVPYIEGDDAMRFAQIASEENAFFFRRHARIITELVSESAEITFAGLHFGMVSPGEVLMGCSKVKVGAMFPILTRPFAPAFLARAQEPPSEVAAVTGGDALVPHGLGMALPIEIVDIVADPLREDYVIVSHADGSCLITDTLEHAGVSYRSIELLPQMARIGSFKIEAKLRLRASLKI